MRGVACETPFLRQGLMQTRHEFIDGHDDGLQLARQAIERQRIQAVGTARGDACNQGLQGART